MGSSQMVIKAWSVLQYSITEYALVFLHDVHVPHMIPQVFPIQKVLFALTAKVAAICKGDSELISEVENILCKDEKPNISRVTKSCGGFHRAQLEI